MLLVDDTTAEDVVDGVDEDDEEMKDGTAGRLSKLVISGLSFCMLACFFCSCSRSSSTSGSATSKAVWPTWFLMSILQKFSQRISQASF